MKRLASGFGLYVLLLQLTGCGSGTTTTTTTGPPPDDSNKPSEVREYEARRAAERAKGSMPPAPKQARP